VTGTLPTRRLAYLDWLRGVTVLVMIAAHSFDAWTLPAERARPWFGRIVMVAGMAAPLFLFLAGVAVSLAAASHVRRGRSLREASRAVQRRGWQIFAYAFLFRFQSFALGGFAVPASLLKVDILNIMGPAIAMTAALWGLAGTRVGKALWLSLTTIAVVVSSPMIRASTWIDPLPDPIEWYLRPPVGRGTFTLLPWAAFVLAGGVLGAAIDGAANRWRPLRLHTAVAFTGGALLALGAWAAFQPALFPTAGFWSTSPAFFAARVGLMVLLVAISWLWTARPWRRDATPTPLETLGAGSFFVYWVHVELIYGVAGSPLRRQLTLEQGVLAWLGVSLAMYALLLSWNGSVQLRLSLRDQVIKHWRSMTWAPRPASER
jgi:uncharacterized membrane protein